MQRFLRVVFAFALFAGVLSVALAQTPNADVQTLAFDHIESVRMAEPAIVEIVLVGLDKKRIKLRMTIFAADNLAGQIEQLGH